MDYCKTGRARRHFIFQPCACAALWRVSLQLNLPALARKLAIWIGLSVTTRSGEQSRSSLLDVPVAGEDAILGRVLERAAEDAEWLAVARVLLSVGASGTSMCHGVPLYLFAQDQADKKVRGFNELLAPLLARIGQDVDQWQQPTALLEDRTAECPICFETLWTATPTAFVKLLEGSGESIFHVICAHFFCFDCASQQYMKQQSQQVAEYFCPICRAQAHEVMPMPDIAVNPRLWFQFLDMNQSGQVDQNVAVQALEAMLPIDTERLHDALHDSECGVRWAQGQISELHFWMPGGLLEWVRAHQHDLERAKDRGKAPRLEGDLQDWLRHWDRERRGELDKGQVLRALCEATRISSLETARIQKLKDGIKEIWSEYAVSAGLTRQHCRNGSVAARLQKLAEEVS
ncbi:unnamed protein product [Effrenium voratum]|uniref:RING-type domain-containing protein n=1 Tax=Effrenium voratum TaxID=2562239 RepID=A0AA36MQI0_9DINO|nr:unnamed protein product [Effrenium voratum]